MLASGGRASGSELGGGEGALGQEAPEAASGDGADRKATEPGTPRAETAGADEGGAAAEFSFAQSLFDEKYYYQAAIEFERFLFYHPSHPLSGRARLAIARCHQEGKQFEKALELYRRIEQEFKNTDLAAEAAFRAGETAYQAGLYERSVVALEHFVEAFPRDPRAAEATYRVGWARIRLHEYAQARELFARLASSSGPDQKDLYRAASLCIAEALGSIRDMRERSPVAAALLSAVLPGAGHVYAGAYKDGLLAFLVNAALIGGAYEAFDKRVYVAGGLVSAIGAGFYSGNIYGAINSAYHANEERLEAILRPLEKDYEYLEPVADRWGERSSEKGKGQ
jgi:TolA-binding protein